MRAPNRKPRVTKGFKQQLKQAKKSLIKALSQAAGPTQRKDQWWRTPQAVRAGWLMSFSTSNYKPHQGAKEKARRVKHMQEHTHGY